MSVVFERVTVLDLNQLLRCPKCLALVQQGEAKGHNDWHREIAADLRALATKVAAQGVPGRSSSLGDLFGGLR